METHRSSPFDLATLEHIDPTWAWHHDTLLQLRQKLLHARAHQQSSVLPDMTPDTGEPNAPGCESEQEILLDELLAESERLPEIEAALRRLRAGTYGVCEETGEPISATRLHLMPWTRFARSASNAGLVRNRRPSDT